MSNASNERRILHIYGLTDDEYSKLRVKGAQADMTLSKYCYQLLREKTENFTQIDLKSKEKKK